MTLIEEMASAIRQHETCNSVGGWFLDSESAAQAAKEGE
jgi:hypothetical protein